MVYTKHGQGSAYCDGKKYTLADGTWFLAFPNQVHHYADCANGEYFLLIIKPSDLLRYGQNFLMGTPENAAAQLDKGQNDNMEYLLETAFGEYQQDGYSDVIAAYLTVIFGKLLPFFPIKKATFSRDTTLKILQYCAANYKEDLTVKSVAEHLSISCSCVSHIFSDRLAMGFGDYINALRLAEAEELLKNKSYTITEIANSSGFPTIRTFNRVFLKKHGISPSVYRKTI
jgi:AraC-like DNA-binding protein